MFSSMQRAIVTLFVLSVLATQLWAADPSVNDLIQASKTGGEAARCKAIDGLAALGDKAADAVPTLTQLLSDNSANVRAHAAYALGRVGAPAKSAAAALTSLIKDNDEVVRRQAIKALTAIKPGPDVMIPLVTRLLEESDAGVQMRIVQAVSEAGAAAVPALIQALQNERSAYWACLMLRQMGPDAKEAVPALTARLSDARSEIRREAALSLGALGPSAAPAAAKIADLLDDPDTAPAATLALGQIGQMPPGAEAKVRANAQKDQKVLGTISLCALAHLHPEDKELARSTAEQLVGRLQDSDPFVQLAAARGLAALRLSPDILLPVVEKALANADEATIRHALDGLAALGAPAVPRLTDALKHESIRARVAYTLGQIGPPAAPASGALAKLLDSKDSKTFSEVAFALAKIGPGAAASVPALIAALKQPECPNPHAVLYALGKIGSASAAAKPELIRLIGDKDQSTAVMAVWALVQVDPRSPEITSKGVPVLIAGLNHSLPEPRQMAAETLGMLKASARNAAPSLEKAAKDDSPAVRAAAQEALRAIRP
jgi:HEAT repeat protein